MLTFSKNLLMRTGFWLLLPVSALQGIRLRSSAIRLPEASGDRRGICGEGTPLHLLAMGDSIIAGVGTGTVLKSMPVQFARALAEQRQCSVHWRVEGSNGADIDHLLKRVRRIKTPQPPDVVLISIGVNDVTGLSSKRHWRTRLQKLTAEISSKWPRARVIFAGLPPMAKFPLPPQPLQFTLGRRAADLDAIAAEYLGLQANMWHIPTSIDPLHHDFCEDGFHPSAESCQIWAEELVQNLKSDTLTG